MTPEFLEQMILQYPNSYQLGEALKRFYSMWIDHKDNMSIVEIENMFMREDFQFPM